MHNSFSSPKGSSRRVVATLLLALGLLLTSGCGKLLSKFVKNEVKIPPLLGPLADASTQQMAAEVNRLATVRSIKGKIDIQVQDNSFAESGLAEKYKAADGTVYLQRPGQVYLRIQAPFVGTNIAEMTSDGEHFRVAVLQGDEKIKRFVMGTNNAVYPKLSPPASGKGDKKKKGAQGEQTASVLSSIRPQHFTDALMIRPIEMGGSSGLVYVKSEFYQEEDADGGQRGKKQAERVVRGYFLLDEIAQGESGGHLSRRFWFDRVNGIRLARIQTFDKDGMLESDVSYFDPKAFGGGEGGTFVMPSRIELTRPHDLYKLSVAYQSPEAVELDREYRPNVFVLENKWQLPVLDLDERERQRGQVKK
ncbi:MAG: hypothetical protein M3362_22800 [Acidobacteriota bacterium]|nr:hypothetical protein [Acidobacteriota bacterium]